MLSPGTNARKIGSSSTAEDASRFLADPETFNYGDIFDSFVSENAYAFPDSSEAGRGLPVYLPSSRDVPAEDLPILGGEDLFDQRPSADLFSSTDVFVAGDGVHNLGYPLHTAITTYSPSHTSTIHSAIGFNTDGQDIGQSNVNSPHSDIRMSSENRKAADIRRLEQELEEIELQKREIAVKRMLNDLRRTNGSSGEGAQPVFPTASGCFDPIKRRPGNTSDEGHDTEFGDFEAVFPVGAIVTQVRVRLTMSQSTGLSIPQSSFDQGSKSVHLASYDLSVFDAPLSRVESHRDCRPRPLDMAWGADLQHYPTASSEAPNRSSNVKSQALVRRKRPRSPSFTGYMGVTLYCRPQREELIPSVGSKKQRRYCAAACYVCRVMKIKGSHNRQA